MRARVQQSSSVGSTESSARPSPAPGKRPLTANLQRKPSGTATNECPVQLKGAGGGDTGGRDGSPQDLMDFFMGPAPNVAPAGVQMKPTKDASSDEMPANVLDKPTTLAFDTVFQLAQEALWALEKVDHEKPDHAKRDALVDEYSSQIEKAATAATQLVAQQPWQRREIFYVPAEMAAEKLLEVLKWITSRTGNARMRSRFERALHVFDGALTSLSREPVTARPMPALRARESIEADDETKALDDAQTQHAIALRDLRDAKIHSGINPFETLAGLEDNAEPSFLVEMVKSIFVATLGHLAGGVLGLAMRNAGTRAARATTRVAESNTAVFGPAAGRGLDATVKKVDLTMGALEREAIASVNEHFKNVTIDSVQGIGAVAADKALVTANGDQNAKKKALTFFAAGLRNAVGAEHSQHEALISHEKAAGLATAENIRHETAVLRAMQSEIGALYLQRASAGWASYLAQGALGKTGSHDPSGRQASNMKNFLGESLHDDAPNGARAFGTDKAQFDGVLHLHLEIDADARRGTKADIRRKGRVTIEGVNDTLREQILAEASGHIGKVWLPKVVYVSMASNSFQAARLALDERNVLRDHTEWNYIARHTQHVADRTFETPQAFAQHLLRTELA
jgi:hypothetical protein